MGSSLAILGDTAVVGAPNTYVSPLYPSGTADIFRNGASGWQLEAQLTPQPLTANQLFGYATALGPDLAVVGGFTTLVTFQRAGSTWTQVDSKDALVSHDIGLSDDTLVSAGTVYIRAGSGWQVQAELQALAGDSYALENAAIDGDFVVEAASFYSTFDPQRAVYFFSRTADTWTQEGFVELGRSAYPVHVGVSGNTAILGVAQSDSGPAVVRVFERDDLGVWNDRGVLDAGTELTGDLPVAIDGDRALVGWNDGGAAFAFARSGGVWTRTMHFDDPAYARCFSAVALSGTSALAGCPDTVAPTGGIGMADVFSLATDPPPVIARFDQGLAYAGEQLGNGVAMSDARLVAQGGQGSFVFAKSGGAWTLETSIPLPAGYNSWYAVALDADTFAAGYNQFRLGAVGVYTWTGQAWAQQAFLERDEADYDYFGYAVALRGNMLVAGEPNGVDAGACRIYERSGSSWSETQTLTPAGNGAGDLFCAAVAMDDDTLVVGAPQADTVIGDDAGAAYVFVPSTHGWTQRARLVAPIASANAHFGASVAVNGDVAVVGGTDGMPQTSTRGDAYVFRRYGDTWQLQASLKDLLGTPPSGSFGYRVGLSASGDKVFVTSPVGAVDRPGNGVVYMFSYDGTQWAPTVSLEGSPPFEGSGDGFGTSLSVSGDAFAIGAPNDGVAGAVYQGSAAETIFASGFDPSP
jgi:hypothetical protein